MEKTVSKTQNQNELAEFMAEIRERFAAAGKPKAEESWFRALLKKIFG